MANSEQTAEEHEHTDERFGSDAAAEDEASSVTDEPNAADPEPTNAAVEAEAVEDGEGDADELTAAVDAERLAAEVARLTDEVNQWQAQYARMRADLENIRRRKDEEIASLKEYAAADVMKQLLPVLDNLERAEAAAESAVSDEAVGLRDGLRLVLRQFRQVLEAHGVEALPGVGQPFDPNLHEAVLEVEATDEHPAGTIVEELQKGYRMHERVLRYSMVKVAVG